MDLLASNVLFQPDYRPNSESYGYAVKPLIFCGVSNCKVLFNRLLQGAAEFLLRYNNYGIRRIIGLLDICIDVFNVQIVSNSSSKFLFIGAGQSILIAINGCHEQLQNWSTALYFYIKSIFLYMCNVVYELQSIEKFHVFMRVMIATFINSIAQYQRPKKFVRYLIG